MNHDDQPPGWLAEFNRQIKPTNWCIPVEDVWRKYGWVPPSRECPVTMARQHAYRAWTAPLTVPHQSIEEK